MLPASVHHVARVLRTDALAARGVGCGTLVPMRNDASVVRGPLVVLEYEVPGARRGELLDFFARAFPIYERPGGIRMSLHEDVDRPGRYVEIAAYADREAFDRDQVRVEQDPEMRATLEEFRSFAAGAITVHRAIPVQVAHRPSTDEAENAAPIGDTRIAPFRINHAADVCALLRDAGLPEPDSSDRAVEMLVSLVDGRVTGCIGWERDGDRALLRSTAVREDARRRGLGRALVDAARAQLRAEGVREVFLFTVSARDFFAQLGFAEIARTDVPNVVRESRQFAMHCCGDAACMRFVQSAS